MIRKDFTENTIILQATNSLICYSRAPMTSLKKRVEEELLKAAELVYPDRGEKPLIVTPATQEKFGHYQCNSAMQLAGALRKSPREIAERLAEAIDKEVFEMVEVAGPGFINFTFKGPFLSSLLDEAQRDSKLGVRAPEKKERVIVEFSSPNIAKEMHVGHLRSTIIGDALARLFEFLGFEVIRLNHVGDWGTAFGMLIAYMRERGLEATNLPELMQWYRASKQRFDEDQAFKDEARAAVVALQGGESEALKTWKQICQISREAFEEVYDLLDIHLEERGESFYNPMLSQVVADLEKKGMITLSEGAKCVFHEGYKIPLMVQKSDGGYNYDTTDMAAILHRVESDQADRIIVVTDAGQRLHFELIRETAQQAGYLDPNKVRFDHVTFGVVLGPDGKKFKTRSGEVEKLIDLLQAAIERAREILLERGHEGEVDELARLIGIAAVKYADLSCNRVSDYVFSYDRMLRFEGNTAAFILYAYVRINGIKRKIGAQDLKDEHIHLEHPAEIDLGVHLLRFQETLKAVQEELFPNYLTDYLYTLAQKFNAFFRDCRVEGDPAQNRRLLLCDVVARTLATGLQILGIQTVERM